MRNSFFVLLVTLFCSLSVVFAQRQEIDSLKKVLPKYAESDSNYINTLNELAFKYYVINPDTTLILTEKAISLAKESHYDIGQVDALRNKGIAFGVKGDYTQALKICFEALRFAEKVTYKKGMASLYNNIANVYQGQGNYPEALENYFKVLKIREQSGDKKGIAASLNNIAVVYNNQGNYPEALENYFKSLKIREEIGDKKGIAYSLNNIGLVYDNQGKYPEALENYFKSLKIKEEIGDKRGISASLSNIAIIYQNQGKYPEALDFFFKALKIREEMGDKNGITLILNNIAKIYRIQGKYAEALKNYFDALKINEEIGDKQGITYSKTGLANVYLDLKNYAPALQYARGGLEIAKEIGEKKQIRDINETLSKIYKATGKYELALLHYEQFKSYADSINNLETEKKTANLQAKYEFDKKTAVMQAEQAKKDIKQNVQKQQLYWVIFSAFAGLLSVMIILFLIFRSRKKIQNAYDKLEVSNAQVQQSKEEIEAQSDLLQELMQTKQLLIGAIVHDLKTPIANIIQTSKEKKVLQTAGQMQNMVLNILEIEKLEDLKMVLYVQENDLQRMMESAVQQIAFMAEKKNIEIEKQYNKKYTISCDAALIERVIVNLLSNAIKYTGNNGEITIKVNENIQQEGFVSIEISDNGQGIPKEHLPHIFDKFFQINPQNTASYRSSGLGLTFCKMAVETHGGQIRAESEVGKGSTIGFSLPLVEIENNENEQVIFIEKVEKIQFSREEIAYLQPFMETLQNIDIAEYGALKKILKEIDVQESEAIKVWKEKLTNTIHTSNESEFKKLISNDIYP